MKFGKYEKKGVSIIPEDLADERYLKHIVEHMKEIQEKRLAFNPDEYGWN